MNLQFHLEKLVTSLKVLRSPQTLNKRIKNWICIAFILKSTWDKYIMLYKYFIRRNF